jgi:hypothetical protein
VLDWLSSIALTSVDEALAYIARDVPGAERQQAINASNSAAALLEELTGRKLAFRTYRDQLTLGLALHCTADSAAITGYSGTTVKEGDAAYAPGELLRPDSQVAIAGAIALILNKPALQTGEFALTVGSEPEIHDGPESGSDSWPLYADQYPVAEVFAVKEIDSNGAKRTLDLTGMRIVKSVGAIYLPNDALSSGAATVELHYSAGLRFPTFSHAGDNEASIVQLATHRLALVNFKDWSGGAGRETDIGFGSITRRTNTLAVPADVERMVAILRRRG